MPCLGTPMSTLRIPTPAYPTHEILRSPRIPPAPVWVSGGESSSLEVAVKLWSTAIVSMAPQYRHEPSWCGKGEANARLLMEQLSVLGIPAAEWVRYRLGSFTWSSLSQKLKIPPFTYVWSPGAFGDCLEKPDLDWIGDLVLERTVMTESSRWFVQSWNKTRRLLVVLQAKGLPIPPDAWAWYEAGLATVRARNLEAQAVIDTRVRDGRYVW